MNLTLKTAFTAALIAAGSLMLSPVSLAGDTRAEALTGIAFEKDAGDKYQHYEVFAAGSSEPRVGVIFAPKEDIRNFEVLALTFNPNSRGYLLTTSTSPSTILFTRVTHRQD